MWSEDHHITIFTRVTRTLTDVPAPVPLSPLLFRLLLRRSGRPDGHDGVQQRITHSPRDERLEPAESDRIRHLSRRTTSTIVVAVDRCPSAGDPFALIGRFRARRYVSSSSSRGHITQACGQSMNRMKIVRDRRGDRSELVRFRRQERLQQLRQRQ